MKTKRQSKHERLSMAMAQDYAHQNTTVINSRRRVLQFEAEETDKSIVALQASLAMLKERRAKLAAMVEGLSVVVARR